MSDKPDKYVPKHRAPGKHRAERPRRALRTGVALSGAAVVVTGVTVTSSLMGSGVGSTGVGQMTLSAAGKGEVPAVAAGERSAPVSRSASRRTVDAAKAAMLSSAGGPASTESEDLSQADPREIAKALLPEYGFSADQFSCLDSLYVSESNWRIDADNPSSSAYGIPQALVGLHDMPAGYMTSAVVQIRWGLDYISHTYGTPCSAWSFKASHGWY